VVCLFVPVKLIRESRWRFFWGVWNGKNVIRRDEKAERHQRTYTKNYGREYVKYGNIYGVVKVLGSEHINLEKNTKERNWKIVKHVRNEVEIRFVRCCSSVSCYSPSIPPLHSPSLPSLFYPLLFLSLPQIQNMSSLLPFPSVTPPPCRHTHTHTHTFYLTTLRMCQYGGSGYPTSTSTARASVLSVFSTAKLILSFLLFL
jgi:hypothetical protein